MTVSNEGRRRKRRKNRWDSTARINPFFPLVFLLILALQVSLSCGEEIKSIGGSPNSIRTWSPARKSRFFESPPYPYSRASQMVNSSDNSSDNLYEEEKRLVHTGPNPLHN